jgi:hypothetical protein
VRCLRDLAATCRCPLVVIGTEAGSQDSRSREGSMYGRGGGSFMVKGLDKVSVVCYCSLRDWNQAG